MTFSVPHPPRQIVDCFRHMLVCSSLLCAVILISGCQWVRHSQSRSNDLCRTRIEQSFNAQQNGDLGRAREYLVEAVDSQSDHAEAWWALAEISIQQDRYNDAIHELQRYSDLNPTDPQAYLRLAQLYYVQNRFQEAEEPLQEAIKRVPNNLEAIMLSARLARKQADHQRAISEYYHALQVSPDYPEATLELAELLLARTEPEQAATLLRSLTRKTLNQEDRARSHLNLGIAYGQSQRWDNAVDQLELAYQGTEQPSSRDRYRLAYAHWKAGTTQQSLKMLIELADEDQWDKRSDALYTLITRSEQSGSDLLTIQTAGFSRQKQTPTIAAELWHPSSLFAPESLISPPESQEELIVPPEWVHTQQ